ncbi:MAG TPA: YdeI/OmpD-associated family protein [Solirubrobacteraceae bacterium]|nr:YdeI/OmpD-associated family protein [Solirubrobacteraceae bacterium]
MTEHDALFFDGPEAFEAWLEQHGETSGGVWVRIAKKHTGVASLDWPRAVEVVLCFGWIDGQSRRVDDDWYVQRFTPRRPRSIWSKVNRRKAEALIAAGRMRPAGLAEVDRAKADGRWDAAYDGMATAAPPEDLAAALRDAGLTAMFAGLDARNRYAILHRVQTAKKPETRARRIEKYVGMLAAGETPYPTGGRGAG